MVVMLGLLRPDEPIVICSGDIGIAMRTVEIEGHRYILIHCRFRTKSVNPEQLKMLHSLAMMLRNVHETCRLLGIDCGLDSTVRGVLLSGAVPLWGLLALIGVVGYIEPCSREHIVNEPFISWTSSDIVVRELSRIYVYDPKQDCFINFRGEKVPVTQEVKKLLTLDYDALIESRCFK